MKINKMKAYITLKFKPVNNLFDGTIWKKIVCIFLE